MFQGFERCEPESRKDLHDRAHQEDQDYRAHDLMLRLKETTFHTAAVLATHKTTREYLTRARDCPVNLAQNKLATAKTITTSIKGRPPNPAISKRREMRMASCALASVAEP